MQIANSDKPVAFYSLDIIIAERNKKDAPVRERPKKAINLTRRSKALRQRIL